MGGGKRLLNPSAVNVDIISFRFVYVWDTTSRRILYKLPGHAGSVNEVAFHPEEPISKCCIIGVLSERLNKDSKMSSVGAEMEWAFVSWLLPLIV